MSKLNGTYKLLYIKVGTEFFPIGCLTDNSFSESVEMMQTTTRDNPNGWGSSIPTSQSYSISFSGILETSDLGSTVIRYRDLKDLKRARTKIEWQIMSSKGGDTDSGYGYITSLGDSAAIDEFITFTGEIEGYGEPIVVDGVVVPTIDLIDMSIPYNEAKID